MNRPRCGAWVPDDWSPRGGCGPVPQAAGPRRAPAEYAGLLFGALIALGIVALALVPDFMSRGYARFTGCTSTVTNLGSALAMYAHDHQNRYPASLEQLTPTYLKSLPTCLAAGRETYGYVISLDFDTYTVFCSGHHHRSVGIEPDYPKYDSIQGLIEK